MCEGLATGFAHHVDPGVGSSEQLLRPCLLHSIGRRVRVGVGVRVEVRVNASCCILVCSTALALEFGLGLWLGLGLGFRLELGLVVAPLLALQHCATPLDRTLLPIVSDIGMKEHTWQLHAPKKQKCVSRKAEMLQRKVAYQFDCACR